MAKILDGKALSQRLMDEYKARIEEINRNDSICLAMVIAVEPVGVETITPSPFKVSTNSSSM